jgi:hypothetical protein
MGELITADLRNLPSPDTGVISAVVKVACVRHEKASAAPNNL